MSNHRVNNPGSFFGCVSGEISLGQLFIFATCRTVSSPNHVSHSAFSRRIRPPNQIRRTPLVSLCNLLPVSDSFQAWSSCIHPQSLSFSYKLSSRRSCLIPGVDCPGSQNVLRVWRRCAASVLRPRAISSTFRPTDGPDPSRDVQAWSAKFSFAASLSGPVLLRVGIVVPAGVPHAQPRNSICRLRRRCWQLEQPLLSFATPERRVREAVLGRAVCGCQRLGPAARGAAIR